MTEKAKEPRRSPLHARHEALGAVFGETPFLPSRTSLVPRHYGSALDEHRAVRESAGVFDLTHLGQLMVAGPGTAKALNELLTNDVDRLDGPGKAQYTLACDEDGGVIDDLVLYRFTENTFMIFGNVPSWIDVASRINDETPDGVEVRVVDGTQAILAVQGPEAETTLERLGLPVGHDRMCFEIGPPEWSQPFVNRWGFTGEDGYEVVVDIERCTELWDALVEAGVRPCGMDARESLRLEMGYPLYGRDVSRRINPIEARLAWAIGWSKSDFRGKDALDFQRTAGPRRRLWGLEATDGRVPDADLAVLDGDRDVGATTSAGYSPTLERGIALALLDAEVRPGAELELDAKDGPIRVRVVKPPFVTAAVR